MTPTEPLPPVPPQMPPPPPPGPPSKPRTGLWIGIAAAAVAVVLAVALIVVFVWKPWSKPASEPEPNPSNSTPGPPKAGFVADPSLRNVTLPARGADLHGCLATAVTLTNGQGAGSGVVGNGNAGPVNVMIAGDPLVGRFSDGGELVRVYGLYCNATDDPAVSNYIMVDFAVTDASGAQLPLVPPDAFDVIVRSMSSSVEEFFPTFDAASLKLSSAGSTVTYGGLTAHTQYSGSETFEFALNPTMGSTSRSVQLIATSKKIT